MDVSEVVQKAKMDSADYSSLPQASKNFNLVNAKASRDRPDIDHMFYNIMNQELGYYCFKIFNPDYDCHGLLLCLVEEISEFRRFTDVLKRWKRARLLYKTYRGIVHFPHKGPITMKARRNSADLNFSRSSNSPSVPPLDATRSPLSVEDILGMIESRLGSECNDRAGDVHCNQSRTAQSAVSRCSTITYEEEMKMRVTLARSFRYLNGIPCFLFHIYQYFGCSLPCIDDVWRNIYVNIKKRPENFDEKSTEIPSQIAEELEKMCPINLFDDLLVYVMWCIYQFGFPQFISNSIIRLYYETIDFSFEKINLSVKSFFWHKSIGRGGFGIVHLVVMKTTGKPYAVKCMSKQLLKHRKACRMIMTERDVMASVSSPFVTGLKFAFEDVDNVYFIMDLLTGGDLDMYLLQKKIKFTPLQISHLAAEIVLGLKHLHERGIVHRDIKPANIMINSRGHAVIADLGMATFFDMSPQNKRENVFKHTVKYPVPDGWLPAYPPNAQIPEVPGLPSLVVSPYVKQFPDNVELNVSGFQNVSSNERDKKSAANVEKTMDVGQVNTVTMNQTLTKSGARNFMPDQAISISSLNNYESENSKYAMKKPSLESTMYNTSLYGMKNDLEHILPQRNSLTRSSSLLMNQTLQLHSPQNSLALPQNNLTSPPYGQKSDVMQGGNAWNSTVTTSPANWDNPNLLNLTISNPNSTYGHQTDNPTNISKNSVNGTSIMSPIKLSRGTSAPTTPVTTTTTRHAFGKNYSSTASHASFASPSSAPMDGVITQGLGGIGTQNSLPPISTDNYINYPPSGDSSNNISTNNINSNGGSLSVPGMTKNQLEDDDLKRVLQQDLPALFDENSPLPSNHLSFSGITAPKPLPTGVNLWTGKRSPNFLPTRNGPNSAIAPILPYVPDPPPYVSAGYDGTGIDFEAAYYPPLRNIRPDTLLSSSTGATLQNTTPLSPQVLPEVPGSSTSSIGAVKARGSGLSGSMGAAGILGAQSFVPTFSAEAPETPVVHNHEAFVNCPSSVGSAGATRGSTTSLPESLEWDEFLSFAGGRGAGRSASMSVGLPFAGKELGLRGKAGTPGFWAPEELLHEADGQSMRYGPAVDWWAFGCLLYALHYNRGPFTVEGGNTSDDNKATLANQPLYDDRLSPEAKDLVQKLLQSDPRKRIGSKRGAEEIMEHPFFKKLDWNLFERQRVKPFLEPCFNVITDKANVRPWSQHDKAIISGPIVPKEEFNFSGVEFVNIQAYQRDIIENMVRCSTSMKQNPHDT